MESNLPLTPREAKARRDEIKANEARVRNAETASAERFAAYEHEEQLASAEAELEAMNVDLGEKEAAVRLATEERDALQDRHRQTVDRVALTKRQVVEKHARADELKRRV